MISLKQNHIYHLEWRWETLTRDYLAKVLSIDDLEIDVTGPGVTLDLLASSSAFNPLYSLVACQEKELKVLAEVLPDEFPLYLWWAYKSASFVELLKGEADPK